MINSTRLRWASYVASTEEGRNDFEVFAGKPTGRRPLRRPKRRWEDTIGIDLKEMGINTRNWVDLAQDRNYWIAIAIATLKLRVS